MFVGNFDLIVSNDFCKLKEDEEMILEEVLRILFSVVEYIYFRD